MRVSCGFIIHTGESHTEGAEASFNGPIFSKMERNEMRQHIDTDTHKQHLQ